MAKHFAFQSMVPTVLNTWEVFLCLTYFKAIKSGLLSLLASLSRQLIVLLSSLLLTFFNLAPLTFLCAQVWCICVHMYVWCMCVCV